MILAGRRVSIKTCPAVVNRRNGRDARYSGSRLCCKRKNRHRSGAAPANTRTLFLQKRCGQASLAEALRQPHMPILRLYPATYGYFDEWICAQLRFLRVFFVHNFAYKVLIAFFGQIMVDFYNNICYIRQKKYIGKTISYISGVYRY